MRWRAGGRQRLSKPGGDVGRDDPGRGNASGTAVPMRGGDRVGVEGMVRARWRGAAYFCGRFRFLGPGFLRSACRWGSIRRGDTPNSTGGDAGQAVAPGGDTCCCVWLMAGRWPTIWVLPVGVGVGVACGCGLWPCGLWPRPWLCATDYCMGWEGAWRGGGVVRWSAVLVHRGAAADLLLLEWRTVRYCTAY